MVSSNFCKRLSLVWAIVIVANIWSTASIRAEARTDGSIFPISKYPEQIYISARVAGAERNLLIDSGTSGYAFHTDVRRELGVVKGESNIISATGEKVKLEQYDSPIVRIGDLTISKEALACCLDLTEFREAAGCDFDGIVGMPLFQSAILRLDFDSHRLVILPLDTEPNPKWGQRFYVSYNESKLPTIFFTFEDEAGWIHGEACIIDTGYSGSLSLSTDMYNRLLEKQLIESRGEWHATMLGGSRKRRQGMLAGMAVEGLEMKGILVDDGGPQSESRIGLGCLRRLCVTFDISRNQIYLAKGRRFGKPDKISLVGIGLLRRCGKTVIASVQPDSPANKAKVEVDDELVAIAGEPIAHKSLAEVRSLLREVPQANSSLSLTCRRNGQDQNVVLKTYESSR